MKLKEWLKLFSFTNKQKTYNKFNNKEVENMKKKAYCVTITLLVLFPFFVCSVSPIMAQGDYPARHIEGIIAFPPGGTTDLAARFLAGKWSEFLGQPVVVVNKPGGGGVIGSKFVANAKPDGYTLHFGNDSNLFIARFGKKDVGYDLDSFRYIFLISNVVTYLSVKADSKWKNLNEFLLNAKQNPGKLKYAANYGAAAHFTGAMLSKAAGVDLTFVAFKSSSETLTALIGGHIDLGITVGLAGMSDSPLIRVLAVAEEERMFNHPEIPTLKEMGYPIFTGACIVLCGPKNIPEKVVSKFTEAHQKVIAKYGKEVKEKLLTMENYFSFLDGESTAKFLKESEDRYQGYATKAGIKF